MQANEFPNHRWGPAGATGVNNDPLLLNKDETYRIEMQILRTGTNTFNMHVGVYEGNDTTPLYDDADFRNVNGTASLASTPQLLFKDIAELHQFQIGHNGFTGGVESDYGFIISYQGGFAICTETWCGPYAGGI